MALKPGQAISHYRIIDKIGEGGMGEVYRATDTKLSREVALKVIPEAFIEDAERLARFSREAQLLASLNHPNIASIHGLEDAGGCNALVLELIEGDTLAKRVSLGPMEWNEAAPVALQIAEALEAAHEKGIIHRDLKPSNVKITPEEVIKVLDFGLAKALDPKIPNRDLSLSPTMTAQGTQAGIIMGTAAYMSPEQAKGRPLDRRTDIWAFGVVLYEMLVGHNPFRGEDVSEMLAHIITREPDLDKLPPDLPAGVDDLIRRCLRKDLRMRLPDIAAARIALQEMLDSPRTVSAEVIVERTTTSVWSLLLAGAAGLALGLLALYVLPGAPSTGPQPATHLDLALDPSPDHWAMSLSSDGGTLVYSGREAGARMLYLRELDGYESRAIPGTEGGHVPIFSPDDSSIAFFSAGRLKRVALLGGMPEPLCAAVGEISSAVWTAQDEILLSTTGMSLPRRVSATGGDPVPLQVKNFEEGARMGTPRALPGGKALLVTVTSPSTDGPRVAVVNLESGEWKVIARGEDPQLVGSSTLMYVQQDRIMVAELDTGSWELAGPERTAPLTDPAISGLASTRRFYASTSANGTLLYPTGEFGTKSWLFWVGPDGRPEAVKQDGAYPKIDPAGQRAIVTDEDSNVWAIDLSTGVRTQLTFAASSAYPQWSRDGRRVIFADQRGNRWRIYSITPDGSGEPEVLFEDLTAVVPTSIGRDGTIMGYRIDPETSRDIWMLSPDGELTMLLDSDYNERVGVISPDGRAFAYVSDEEGSDEIYIRQLPGTDRRWRVTTQGGMAPLWSVDGRELLFRTGDTIMAAEVSTEGPVRVGPAREIFTSDRLKLDLWGNQTFDMAPDGRLMISLVEPSDARTRIVLGWDRLLEAAP